MDLVTIEPVLDWIAQYPRLSGFVVFLVAASESLALVGIVVPGVVFMLGIGALVGLNAINLWQALFWATVGAIAGDWVSYWLGRHFDQQLRHIWPLSRYPKLIPKGEKFFHRHGGMSVFFGRFVGPLRPVIPAIAGIMHMPQGKFYFINVISAILWAPVVILPGVAFGESIQLANDVFGKLIILIVLLILVAVIAGYIFKKMFAYALMVSIDTLGDYFGIRSARENVISLSLMAVMATGLFFFVYRYEVHYQPLANKNQATDYQWWHEHWQDYSNVQIKHRSEFPVTVQWWGEKQKVHQVLQKAGWQDASRLNLKTSMNFFLPSVEITRLPVFGEKLFNASEVFAMVLPGGKGGDYWLLRLWAANPNAVNTQEQLWVGTVYGISVVSPFDVVHVPLRSRVYSNALSQFGRSLGLSGVNDIVMIRKQYANIGITANWRGDMLMVEFL